MNIYLVKLITLILGAAGTGLGIYNFILARREKSQKVKHAFATMLLSLDPIIDQLLALPLRQPEDLATLDVPLCLKKLRDLIDALTQGQQDLIGLVPETAGRVLGLRTAAQTLINGFTDPAVLPSALIYESADFYHAAWGLAYFRTMAKYFGITLSGQSMPSLNNWMGDTKVEALNTRWDAFFRVSKLKPNLTFQRTASPPLN